MFLISFFVGGLGVDRFVAGYVAAGLLKLCTAGGFGIWWIVDWALTIGNSIPNINNNCYPQSW